MALLARWTRRCRDMPFQVANRERPSDVVPRQNRLFSLEVKGGSGCVSDGSYLTLSI